jgi:hypothetical protein
VFRIARTICNSRATPRETCTCSDHVSPHHARKTRPIKRAITRVSHFPSRILRRRARDFAEIFRDESQAEIAHIFATPIARKP